MFKQSKEPEKKGSEKREDLLVSFLKDAHFVFAIIKGRNVFVMLVYKAFARTKEDRQKNGVMQRKADL